MGNGQGSPADNLLAAAPKKPTGPAAAEPDLNKALLSQALGVVADELIKGKKNIAVVVVGGAVNTMLGNRASTHDVDFFNAKLAQPDLAALNEAAKKACKLVAVKPALQEGWFNNRTIVFIPTDQRIPLTDESINVQKDVIFTKQSADKKAGLTLYAAPWNYAFCCKIDRYAGSGLIAAQSYDVKDAAFYLQKYMAKNKAKDVKVGEIKAWFTKYKLKWGPNVDIVIKQLKDQKMPIV